ncbi:MAG: F0F1 ATP synthase subunit delta [Paracoccaceae bacterium]
MSQAASTATGIADRYATAVFEITQDSGAMYALEKDIGALDAALRESADLRSLIDDPIYDRADQERAIGAVARKLGLSETLTSTLRLMATKRRLFVLPALVRALLARIQDAKGEVTAEVTTAKPLTKAQSDKLAAILKDKVGSDVRVETNVDEALIGGLVVKVGSRMIDTSVRAKLSALQSTMKEAR